MPTALQKHVSFFDRKNRGKIEMVDTYSGFRALGFNSFIAGSSALAFHLIHVSYPTRAGWFPNLTFPVYVERIARAKHGSDTESYDMDGQFDERRFEGIFKKYDQDNKDGLTFKEIRQMWVGNRNVLDVVGWTFQGFLWSYLWMLAADPVTGVLSKESVRKQYDGTLFYELEKRQASGKKLPWWRGGRIF